MKNLIIFFAIVFIANTQAFAQNTTFNTSFQSDVAFTGQNNTDGNMDKAGEVKPEWADFARLAKPMPSNYTGYKVELLGAYEPLKASHSIYNQFGKLNIETSTDLPFNFYYLIGEFQDEAAAEKFMNQVIINRYPGAKVVRYKKGQRK